jgi:regulator of protease activity HflC (stomatin/prohibitin superfamily)
MNNQSNKSLWFLGGIVAVLILLPLFCVRFVGAGQVGIITRFGEVNRTADSGLALKLPWPIEHITKMETRVQKEEQQSAAATSDLQDVNATLALNYALDNDTALKVYKTIGTDYKNRVVIPALQESFKAATAGYTAPQLITERTAVKGKAYEIIKSRLGKYGIRVVDLNIVNFTFSPEYSKAVELVQVANQQVQQAKQDLERVRVEAEQKVAKANADAEAQRVQQQTLTPALLQKYAIDAWDGKLPTYYGGNQPLFNIPLQGNPTK